jgi:glycosyltransferase involved in cell wall biosynthesis
MKSEQPLIGIVTPVYNGEKYLEACIMSVLSQSYTNWQYIIVNNCSTDRTQEIAEQYVRKESRIELHNNEKFLSALENQNHALRFLPSESKYAKIIHADDMLMPECLMEMLNIAETSPSVGIVGAYRLNGTSVQSAGLPYGKNIFSGKDICRASLLNNLYVFGSPSSILISMKFILDGTYSYNSVNYHADEEACYEVLKYSDFGFVHKILTYSRFHEEQESSFARDVNTFIISKLGILKKYGPFFLQPEEYEKRYKEMSKKYYRFLAKSLFHKKNEHFWEYHNKMRCHFGITFNWSTYFREILLELLDLILNPKNTTEKIIKRF